MALEKVGPYGCEEPENWSFKLDKYDSIKEILINHGLIVDGIGFIKVDANGKLYPTQWFGGPEGDSTRIKLERDEYVTRLSGSSGVYYYHNSTPIIATLKIHTNLCPSGYGPFGAVGHCGNVRSFSSPLQRSDTIVKFFGHQSHYLSSIGFEIRK